MTGRCCPDPSDACCNTDGTCITKSVHFCCSISGACKHDWVCCSGCSPPGSSCCNNNGDYCEEGKMCCPGGCAPAGSTCCKNNRHCRDGLYCVEIDGEPGCCTTPTCREEFPPVTVYYEVITYYWYIYWYIYMYVSVEIDVTTTTVSLTSTQTSTTTRVSVSASDEYDASSYFDDMSSSLESSASRSVDAMPTETPSTVLVEDGTTAPYTPRPTAADPGVTTRPDDFDFDDYDDDDDDGGDPGPLLPPGGIPLPGGGGASAASGLGPVEWLVGMGVALAAGVSGVFMVLL